MASSFSKAAFAVRGVARFTTHAIDRSIVTCELQTTINQALMATEKTAKRCPIAHSADLLGDRWSLVIVRDMLMGKKRFGEFLESSEAITASVLTARLTRLEHAELISKLSYQTNPVRYDYALTAKGRGLLPVLKALSEWGSRNFPNVRRPPDRFMNMKTS